MQYEPIKNLLGRFYLGSAVHAQGALSVPRPASPQNSSQRTGCSARPLPFLYVSTGVETKFTNSLDPEPRSRRIFAPHRPETLREWLQADNLNSGSRLDPDGRGSSRAISQIHLTTVHAALTAAVPTSTRDSRLVAEPDQSHRQPGAIFQGRSSQGLATDGNRQREEPHSCRLHLPPHQVWWRTQGALLGGPFQPW